nr:MAG TPA_asm: hypothetical protein [Caudoviricetes sp.]
MPSTHTGHIEEARRITVEASSQQGRGKQRGKIARKCHAVNNSSR